MRRALRNAPEATARLCGMAALVEATQLNQELCCRVLSDKAPAWVETPETAPAALGLRIGVTFGAPIPTGYYTRAVRYPCRARCVGPSDLVQLTELFGTSANKLLVWARASSQSAGARSGIASSSVAR